MEVVIICWLYKSKASDVVYSTLPVILFSIPVHVNEGLRQGRLFPLEWDFGKDVQTKRKGGNPRTSFGLTSHPVAVSDVHRFAPSHLGALPARTSHRVRGGGRV